ncbi:MAG: YggS family pyridoxal phosphate-dependent enzyme [Candidatus Cloacimonetes bacterium]|nr:YggS family pyridoxal phosphate-dependent enzyme [Candidatus Cloacimonadota bacterium]
MSSITDNIKHLLSEVPEGVEVVAAAKTRTADEILEVIDAGISKIGENYVQEAVAVYESIGKKAQWHFIGHLQSNKVVQVVPIFDMIETVDSVKLARKIDKYAKLNNKIMSILIEVNSGREPQKNGVMPENVEQLIREIAPLTHIKIMGLMTMGPFTGNPENARPFFVETHKIFDHIRKLNILNVEMKYLSMGMSNSYKVAIEEGANIIRVGTKLFGERACKYE